MISSSNASGVVAIAFLGGMLAGELRQAFPRLLRELIERHRDRRSVRRYMQRTANGRHR